MSSRNNPARFTVDFERKEIIGTRTSLNKAKHYGGPEYKELCKLMKAHPQFKIAEKKPKKKHSKQTYKKLGFDFIETYISIQPDAAEIKSEYERVKKIAADLNLGVYPQTKSWFLKKFNHGSESFDMKKAIDELKSTGLNVERFEETESPAARAGAVA